MTGPAQKAKATVASISKPTGAASLIRRRGVTVSSELQNRRMPLRPRAIIPISPEPSMPATSDQAATEGVSVAEVCKAADKSANFPTKAEVGVRQILRRAQKERTRHVWGKTVQV